ncbi:MAG TPA: hypothetical protein VGH64_08925 [Puia sp.]
MTIEYRLNTDQLSNAVDNTIRVFDEYSLRAKPDNKGRQVIMDRSWNGMFGYYISETLQGSRLTIEAKASKPVSVEILTGHEEIFLKNLFKIITKEIAITPEIAARDLHKRPRIRVSILNILLMILIILLVIKSFQGCMKG